MDLGGILYGVLLVPLMYLFFKCNMNEDHMYLHNSHCNVISCPGGIVA